MALPAEPFAGHFYKYFFPRMKIWRKLAYKFMDIMNCINELRILLYNGVRKLLLFSEHLFHIFREKISRNSNDRAANLLVMLAIKCELCSLSIYMVIEIRAINASDVEVLTVI